MPNSKSEILTSFRTRDVLMKDKYFQKYDQKRNKIIEQCGDDWKLKTRKIAELLFTPNGDFQKFMWEHMPEVDKLKQDRLARGRRKNSDDNKIYIE